MLVVCVLHLTHHPCCADRQYSFDVYSPELSFSFCASSDPEKEGALPRNLSLVLCVHARGSRSDHVTQPVHAHHVFACTSSMDDVSACFIIAEWIRAIGRAIVMVKTKRFVNDDGSDEAKE